METTQIQREAVNDGRGRASTNTPKNFVCQREGCNKRFTRDEHLQRHALNHTDGEYTCPRCRAHFKRPDLLDRHLQRHRQRDEEVGGEGYGVLNTRKRAWKAFDGTVVQKKPALTPTTPPELYQPATTAEAEVVTEQKPQHTHPENWTERLTLTIGNNNNNNNNNNTNTNSSSTSVNSNSSYNNTYTEATYAEVPISPPHTSSSHSDPGRQLSVEEADTFVENASLAPLEQQFAPVAPLVASVEYNFLAQDHDSFDGIAGGGPSAASVPFLAPVGFNTINGSTIRPPPQQPLDIPYDNVFQADTASSFNMPYTTAINYNWLFSMDDTYDMGMSDQSVQPMLTFQGLQQSQSQPLQAAHTQNMSGSPDAFSNSPGSQTLVFDQRSDMVDFSASASSRMQLAPKLRQDVLASPQRSASVSSETLPTNTNRNQHGYKTHHAPQKETVLAAISAKRQVTPDNASSELERPLSSIHPPSNLPVIDQETRETLLEVVDSCRPTIPGGQYTTWNHPLLAVPSLQNFCDLYFTRFNTAYPLIHQATFKPSETEPLLLLSVLLLGATYSTKDAHQLAVCIHDVIRPRIFADASFSAKPSLWILQTILLVECFGKSRAGQKQHDMSHLFHGLLINLIRRSDCQSARPVIPNWLSSSGNDIIDNNWKKWAIDEEMKRLALLCFMWDTQHAVLFCQSLCMSAFELRLSMPSSQSLWEASTPEEWKKVAQRQTNSHDILFLTALKFYLTPKASKPIRLNAFSRVLLLHGLLSISWDMQRRDQTSLGVVDNIAGGNWRDRMSDAYGLWKGDFDDYCMDIAVRQRQYSSTTESGDTVKDGNTKVDWEAASREFATFVTAYNAIYHAAHILLNSDFLDVQIYAGARHILGRPVQRVDYIRSERIVKRWATAGFDSGSGTQSSGLLGGGGVISSNNSGADTNGNVGTKSAAATGRVAERNCAAAAKAAWHAACLLHDASHNLDDFDAMGLFHVPWCLYMATLTCWVFHHTRPLVVLRRQGGTTSGANNSTAGEQGNFEDSEIVWDAHKEMDELVSSMAGAKPWNLMLFQGKRKTGGLVWVMANILSNVRWGIVHAGVVVLRGLVPSRMINQYESS